MAVICLSEAQSRLSIIRTWAMKGRILSFIKGQCRNEGYKTLRFSGTSGFFVIEQEIVRSNFL